jgi:hypothetical protein
MRRPALLKVALLGLAGVLFTKRSKAKQAERELWNEATAPTDKG